MKHSMDYLSLIQSIPAHRTALIEDGRFYTYGTLVMEACRIRSLSPEPAAMDQGGLCARPAGTVSGI